MAWVAILGGGGEPCNWQMRCRPQSFIKASVGQGGFVLTNKLNSTK